MFADGLGGLLGADRAIGQIEGGFARRLPQAGGRLEVQDTSFDRDDGGNVGLPFGSGDRRPGIEHRHGPGFVAVAFFAIDRLNAGKRLGIFANSLDVAAQGRLVVF